MLYGRFLDGPVRVLLSGETPTPSFGDLYYDGDQIELNECEMKKAKMVRSGDTNGLFRGHFYRKK